MTECGDLVTFEHYHNGRLGRNHIKAVIRPRHDDGIARDAARAQARRVGDILVVKQIEGADADPGRRQAREIGPPRRLSVSRRV